MALESHKAPCLLFHCPLPWGFPIYWTQERMRVKSSWIWRLLNWAPCQETSEWATGCLRNSVIITAIQRHLTQHPSSLDCSHSHTTHTLSQTLPTYPPFLVLNNSYSETETLGIMSNVNLRIQEAWLGWGSWGGGGGGQVNGSAYPVVQTLWVRAFPSSELLAEKGSPVCWWHHQTAQECTDAKSWGAPGPKLTKRLLTSLYPLQKPQSLAASTP